jgi:hypothetical protein
LGYISAVLEKPFYTLKLYVGSGTDTLRGASRRLLHYNAGAAERSSVPKHVRAALQRGYQITHKGILCSIPLPSPADTQRLRALFILLEATFTFVFWTIKANTVFGLGMHEMRQWTLDSLEYEGLCSHTSLREGFEINLELCC